MLQLIDGPTSEPLTLDEAKLHLRVDGDAEDDLITALIATARAELEFETGRALLTQTWALWLDAWPEGDVLEVPLPPLQSVGAITYFDADDTETELDSGLYFVDTASEPGRIALRAGACWPATVLRPINGVCVEFDAGYGDAGADVPAKLLTALKLLIAWLYENRGDGSAQSPETWPRAVQWLCDAYRVRRGFA